MVFEVDNQTKIDRIAIAYGLLLSEGTVPRAKILASMVKENRDVAKFVQLYSACQ